jgi:F-type H+-transporting ATPase subunit delta
MFVSKIVNNYVSAIFYAAGDELDSILEQLNQLNASISSIKGQYNQAIFNESTGQNILINIAHKLKLNDIVVNLFTKLVKKRRLNILSDICDYIPIMKLKKSGVVQADVPSVKPLAKEDEGYIKNYLKSSYGKEFQIKNLIDESILGGVVISFDSFLLDASVLTKLAKARDYLSKNKEL